MPVNALKKGSEDEDLTLSEHDWALNNFYELGYLAFSSFSVLVKSSLISCL